MCSMNYSFSTSAYVLAMTPPGGMWLIYKHEAGGRKVLECGMLSNQPQLLFSCQK